MYTNGLDFNRIAYDCKKKRQRVKTWKIAPRSVAAVAKKNNTYTPAENRFDSIQFYLILIHLYRNRISWYVFTQIHQLKFDFISFHAVFFFEVLDYVLQAYSIFNSVQ